MQLKNLQKSLFLACGVFIAFCSGSGIFVVPDSGGGLLRLFRNDGFCGGETF